MLHGTMNVKFIFIYREVLKIFLTINLKNHTNTSQCNATIILLRHLNVISVLYVM